MNDVTERWRTPSTLVLDTLTGTMSTSTRDPGTSIFRLVAPGDETELLGLFEGLDPSFFRPHPFTPEEAARIAGRTGRDVYGMLMSDHRPVAYGLLRGWDEGYPTPSLGVAVRTDSQGAGFGRSMMSALHQAARDGGATAVRLRVHPDNVRARRLYESFGYSHIGEERGELVMVLDLESAETAAVAARRPPRRRQVDLLVKRVLDILGALTALILFSPVLAWVSLALLVTQGRPIFFRQRRPGRDAVAFTLIKFRTMRDPGPGEDRYRTDDARVTRLGRFLRTSSLDELPELWNVLRGEMSLVGPRPLLIEYLDVYTPNERRRHTMRPGITSWAAVNGRHVLRFRERLQLDTWYVDHWSLWLDLRIIGMTLRQVIERSDVATTQDMTAIGFPLPPAAAGTAHPGDVPDPPAAERPHPDG